MARPRTPTNVLQLKGAGKKHPERMREREGEPEDDRGFDRKPPDTLAGMQVEAWNEIVGNAIPGVLVQADRTAVMIASRVLAKVYTDEASGTELGHLIKLLGQFGMTPSERSKINLGPQKAKNRFED